MKSIIYVTIIFFLVSRANGGSPVGNRNKKETIIRQRQLETDGDSAPSDTSDSTPSDIDSIPGDATTAPTVTASSAPTLLPTVTTSPSAVASSTPTITPTLSVSPTVTASSAPTGVEVPVDDSSSGPSVPPVDPPVAAPVAAPVADPVAAPVADPVAAPVADPVAAPVSSPVAAPIASAPTSNTNGNNQNNKPDGGAKSDNPKAGESGGRSMFIIYVFTAGALALSAVYLMKIRRRKRLMADRQVVVHHDMRYSNSGGANPHLNELYMDNDLI